MKKIFALIIFTTTVATFSCNSSEEDRKEAHKNSLCVDSTLMRKDAVCTEVFEPVCGCDGKDYSNACKAESAGVTKWTTGKCH